MVAAVLFIASVVALGQFALYYWRAVLAGIASQPLSERIREAAGIDCDAIGPTDFAAVIHLNDLTPGLREQKDGLRAVRVYYRALETLGRLSGLRFPQVAGWVNREMTTCSRYAAVMLDRRLAANVACAAEIRSI
jgi:hypothetical protein